MRARLASSFVVAILGGAAVGHATPAMTIAEVIANGASLQGQTVAVSAAVTDQRFDYAGETTFTVADASGKRLTVFGKGSAPAVNAAVLVTGVVGYKAPDEEFTWPPVLHGAQWSPAP